MWQEKHVSFKLQDNIEMSKVVQGHDLIKETLSKVVFPFNE